MNEMNKEIAKSLLANENSNIAYHFTGFPFAYPFYIYMANIGQCMHSCILQPIVERMSVKEHILQYHEIW